MLLRTELIEDLIVFFLKKQKPQQGGVSFKSFLIHAPLKALQNAPRYPRHKKTHQNPRQAQSSFFILYFLYLGALLNWTKVKLSTKKILQTKIKKEVRRMLTALRDTNVRVSLLVQSIERTCNSTSHHLQVSVRNQWQAYVSESSIITHYKIRKGERSPVHGLRFSSFAFSEM